MEMTSTSTASHSGLLKYSHHCALKAARFQQTDEHSRSSGPLLTFNPAEQLGDNALEIP